MKIIGLLFINQKCKLMKENNGKISLVRDDPGDNKKKQMNLSPPEGNYPNEKREKRPNEIPEKAETEKESLTYPHESEVSRPDRGNDVSYGDQDDVTPRVPHEFPSFGSVKIDFATRKQGRTTGRMVGHEPGTERI